MSLWLDTSGRSSLALGVCARCKMKRPIDDLYPDPNSPGLRCCRTYGDRSCCDDFDPYRLPARSPDQIALRYPRPDTPLDVEGDV